MSIKYCHICSKKYIYKESWVWYNTTSNADWLILLIYVSLIHILEQTYGQARAATSSIKSQKEVMISLFGDFQILISWLERNPRAIHYLRGICTRNSSTVKLGSQVKT